MTSSTVRGTRAPHTSEGKKDAFQTDRRRPGNYETTRWNAAKWQLRREDFMVCTGVRCPYRFCDRPDDQLPPVGSMCRYEPGYAARFGDELLQLFNTKELRQYLDEHRELLWEWIIASLLANRASVRLSRAMEEIERATVDRQNRTLDRRPFEHFALAMRYLTAAHNRINAVWQTIDELCEESRAKRRTDRIRREMLQAGYWNPLAGEGPPAVEEAPAWIVEMVDQECGQPRQ